MSVVTKRDSKYSTIDRNVFSSKRIEVDKIIKNNLLNPNEHDIQFKEEVLYDPQNNPIDQWIVTQISKSDRKEYEAIVTALKRRFELVHYELDIVGKKVILQISCESYIKPPKTEDLSTLIKWVLVFSMTLFALFVLKI
jgi:hypothetical protein